MTWSPLSKCLGFSRFKYHSLTNLNMFNVGYILLTTLSIQYECFHITVNVSVTHIRGGGEGRGNRLRKRKKEEKAEKQTDGKGNKEL